MIRFSPMSMPKWFSIQEFNEFKLHSIINIADIQQ